MSNVQPMAPRKVMTRLEREFLKVAGRSWRRSRWAVLLPWLRCWS